MPSFSINCWLVSTLSAIPHQGSMHTKSAFFAAHMPINGKPGKNIDSPCGLRWVLSVMVEEARFLNTMASRWKRSFDNESFDAFFKKGCDSFSINPSGEIGQRAEVSILSNSR